MSQLYNPAAADTAPLETIETLTRKSELFVGDELCEGLLNRVQEAVMITNEARQIVYANETARKLADGLELEELIGLRPGNALSCRNAISQPGGCGQSRRCAHCGALSAMLESRDGKHATADFSITRVSADGSEARELQAAASPLTMRGELFIFFTLVDISHEKRRRALERIFFHDILNTAGGLRGLAGLIRDGEMENTAETADLIYRQADQMVRDIEMQKILADAENRDLHPTYAPADSLDVIVDMVRFFQAHHETAAQGLAVAPESVSAEFITDQNLVRRVVGNMIKNALEAAGPGGRVTVSSRADRAGVCFEVHNPEVMDDDVKLKVFQRSFSTKGANRGLGTYGMKLLSERYLGGTVDFRSTPSEGTVFRALYPYTIPGEAGRSYLI